MNRKSKLSLVLGIVVLLATICIFFLARPVFLPSTIIGFVFLLYSELVFFGGIILIGYLAQKSSGIITRAGVGLTIEIYALIVFISSLIYMNINLLFYRGFLIIQILLLVVAIIIASLLGVFSKEAYNKDAKVLRANAMCKEFESELILIREQVSDKKSIDKVIEQIRFSDTSSMCDADVEIDDKINELKTLISANETNDKDVEGLVKDIEFLIKKRNLQIKNSNQGGI